MTYKSFLHQILYAYVGFPDIASLVWRYDGLPDTPLSYYGETEDDVGNYCGENAFGGGGGGGGDGGGDNNDKGGECPPCGQIIEDGGCDGVEISWVGSFGATKYIVQYGRDPRIRGAGVQSIVTPDTTVCLRLGLDVRFGETIYYRITTKFDGKQSITSELKSIFYCPSPANQQEADENCCKDADVQIEIEGPPNLVGGGPMGMREGLPEEYFCTISFDATNDNMGTTYEQVPGSINWSVEQPDATPGLTDPEVVAGADPAGSRITVKPLGGNTIKVILKVSVDFTNTATQTTFTCRAEKEITITGSPASDDQPPSGLSNLTGISFNSALFSNLSALSGSSLLCPALACLTPASSTEITGTGRVTVISGTLSMLGKASDVWIDVCIVAESSVDQAAYTGVSGILGGASQGLMDYEIEVFANGASLGTFGETKSMFGDFGSTRFGGGAGAAGSPGSGTGGATFVAPSVAPTHVSTISKRFCYSASSNQTVNLEVKAKLRTAMATSASVTQSFSRPVTITTQSKATLETFGKQMYIAGSPCTITM